MQLFRPRLSFAASWPVLLFVIALTGLPSPAEAAKKIFIGELSLSPHLTASTGDCLRDPAGACYEGRLTVFRVSQASGVRARYTIGELDLRIRLRRLRNGDLLGNYRLAGGPVLTHLRMPDVEGRVRGIEYGIVDAATAASDEIANARLPAGFDAASLHAVYEHLAEQLFIATPELGDGSMRLALSHHASVMGTARRLLDLGACNPNPHAACTPHPEYVEGAPVAFRCAQDLVAPEPGEPGGENEGPTLGCLLGLDGGDWGCCGNYEGKCHFCSPGCYAHDAVCTDCGFGWFCGPDCKPD